MLMRIRDPDKCEDSYVSERLVVSIQHIAVSGLEQDCQANSYVPGIVGR